MKNYESPNCKDETQAVNSLGEPIDPILLAEERHDHLIELLEEILEQTKVMNFYLASISS